jgi:multisubunit Na+/H+ antiporter MnhG subunit
MSASTRRGLALLGIGLVIVGEAVLLTGVFLHWWLPDFSNRLDRAKINRETWQVAVILLMLVVVSVGLLLSWLHTKWRTPTKVLITLVSGLVASVSIAFLALLLFDDSHVADWAQTMGVVFTVAAVVAVAIQVRSEAFRYGTGLLLELQRDYDTDRMLEIRRAAAKSLIDHRREGFASTNQFSPAVTQLLNFFQMVGLMTNKGALDPKMVWDKFFNRMNRYEQLTKEFRRLRQEQAKDPLLWMEFERVVDKLATIELGLRKETGETRVSLRESSRAELDAFLRVEASALPWHRQPDGSEDGRPKTVDRQNRQSAGTQFGGSTNQKVDMVISDEDGKSRAHLVVDIDGTIHLRLTE